MVWQLHQTCAVLPILKNHIVFEGCVMFPVGIFLQHCHDYVLETTRELIHWGYAWSLRTWAVLGYAICAGWVNDRSCKSEVHYWGRAISVRASSECRWPETAEIGVPISQGTGITSFFLLCLCRPISFNGDIGSAQRHFRFSLWPGTLDVWHYHTVYHEMTQSQFASSSVMIFTMWLHGASVNRLIRDELLPVSPCCACLTSCPKNASTQSWGGTPLQNNMHLNHQFFMNHKDFCTHLLHNWRWSNLLTDFRHHEYLVEHLIWCSKWFLNKPIATF